MSTPLHEPLTLTDPGPTAGESGHVRQRRKGTKRSLTTVEFTMAERRVLDQLAADNNSSIAAVMRDALRTLAAQRGRVIDDGQETPYAA